jgi:hypothetical protein
MMLFLFYAFHGVSFPLYDVPAIRRTLGLSVLPESTMDAPATRQYDHILASNVIQHLNSNVGSSRRQNHAKEILGSNQQRLRILAQGKRT